MKARFRSNQQTYLGCSTGKKDQLDWYARLKKKRRSLQPVTAERSTPVASCRRRHDLSKQRNDRWLVTSTVGNDWPRG
jgi:hypothetical protein